MLTKSLFKFFSSLKLAVISILLLSAVLTWGTIAESLYGMRGAHLAVYGQPWFYGVLLLLGTNVFCAAMSRYPWKKHQTGFVVTHAGILILLFGSLLTQRFGVDGNLPVQEGAQDNEVYLSDLRMTLQDEGSGQFVDYVIPETAQRSSGRLLEVAVTPESKVIVDQYIPRAVADRKITASPVKGLGAPALRFELGNNRFHLEEWILSQHPRNPTEINLGPAVVSFQKLWSAEEEKTFLKSVPKAEKPSTKGYLVMSYQGKQYRLNVDEHMKTWKRAGNSGLELSVERYLPYAVVEGNDLVSKSDDPVNPAVTLLVRKGDKLEEKHTIFANFPEFSTLHRTSAQAGNERVGVKFQLTGIKKPGAAPNENLAIVGNKRGELQFVQSADGNRLYYRAVSADGKMNGQGEVKVGQETVTGWMDLKFKVTQWFPSAVEDIDPRSIDYISGESNFLSAVHVTEEKNGKLDPNGGAWIMEGSSRIMSFGPRKVTVAYGKTRLKLPFQLFLDKFTVGMNPGTQKAATYESRVTVRDPASALPTGALISMNEPLHYGGFTFYQASYQMFEGAPPVSVFAVNRDPGRWVKYLGSLLMVLGAALMFWMNPHYWGKIFGKLKGAQS